MSKLDAAMKKAGLGAIKSKTEEKKSSLASVNAPAEIKSAVNTYLEAKKALEEAEFNLKNASGEIVDFAINNALANKSMENVIVEGSEGAVSVVFKDQYSLKSRDALDKILKAHKLDPDQIIEEKSSLDFNFSALTEDEQTKLFEFLSTWGQDRYSQVVSQNTKYSIKGLKDKMAIIAKNRADFDNIKQISGMYTPTVAVRK